MKINKIAPDTSEYLQIVTTIPKNPKRLCYIGTLPQHRRPTVAIVGTRKPTTYGRDVTYKLAYELAAQGCVIVSGLALGVDAIAHRAALDASGTTIAVLANPLPQVSPYSNRELAQRIVQQGGALLAEHTTEDNYVVGKWSFLQRNRIVAGIADAVIITEATARSGTLNTAAHALDQGKTVFVVPGNITSPSSAACNQLLRQGATPVTCTQDILDVIMPRATTPAQTSLPLGTTPLETAVIQQLTAGISDGDELRQVLDIAATDLSVTLTMLELAGTIRPLGANKWSLR